MNDETKMHCTCKHKNLDDTNEPCKSCFDIHRNTGVMYSKWESDNLPVVPDIPSCPPVPPKVDIGSQPAFPTDDLRQIKGLTKREWFAGMAMQSLITLGSYNGWQAAEAATEYADELIGRLGEPT